MFPFYEQSLIGIRVPPFIPIKVYSEKGEHPEVTVLGKPKPDAVGKSDARSPRRRRPQSPTGEEKALIHLQARPKTPPASNFLPYPPPPP